MDTEQARKIVERYRQELAWVRPAKGPFGTRPLEIDSQRHAASMLDKMDGFLNDVDKHDSEWEFKWDKFNRWLGFLQGILWVAGQYTLDEMREHNRPPGVETS